MQQDLKYNAITISVKVAVGTSTLAKNLHEVLGWKYINVGDIQRQYDREHKANENQIKWQKLYGKHDFWDPKSKICDLVIDTSSSGPLETMGNVLDKLGFRHGRDILPKNS